jgi:FkbM family methyltransferase
MGKKRRDALLERVWPNSYDFPKPVLSLMGRPLRRRWTITLGYYWARTRGKTSEPLVSNYVLSRRGRLFVDVGANFGLYCSKLWKNFDRLIAIEADPNIYAELARRCPPNCKPINLAVSNSEGYINFYSATEPTELTLGTMIPERLTNWNGTKKASHAIKVRAAPLSKILENEDEVDLVKVDVEGAEWLVLEGAVPIMPRIKEWIIELHQPTRKAELEKLMKRFGYERFDWLDSRHGVFRRTPSESDN